MLAEVLADPVARSFTLFVFVSMLAYSAQELILEPYAGLVFAMTPGATTKLAGLQHGGVLAGMLLVAGADAHGAGGTPLASLRLWIGAGLRRLGGALLFALASGAAGGPDFPLRHAVFALGMANGAYRGRRDRLDDGARRPAATRASAAPAWASGVPRRASPSGPADFWARWRWIALRLVTAEPVQAYAAVFAAEGGAVPGRRGPGRAARTCRGTAARWRSESAASARGEAMARWIIGGRSFALPPTPGRGGGEAEPSTSSWSAAARPAPPRPPTSPGPGHTVLLLDKPGRIKPCGGAIPPRLIRDFAIPDSLLVAKIRSARMVAPSGKAVDMPVGEGFVGMVDREHFDPWLRARAVQAGADLRAGRLRTDLPAG